MASPQVEKIPGGYYLSARKIKDSDIAKAPPHVREIWNYLMREAFYKDGKDLKRGQLLKTYQDIIDDLSWHVGWRRCSYKSHQCETAMKWLRNRTMITTRKTTRGMVITVCNYDAYQTPENYENHTENEAKATVEPQSSHTIDKKVKKVKKVKKKKQETTIPDIFPITEKMRLWFDKQEFIYIEIESATAEWTDYWKSNGKMMVDWYATWRNGMRKHEGWAFEKKGKDESWRI